MIRLEFIFQDLFLYCTNEVPKNHNHFGYFRHGGETHFLALAQTLIYSHLQLFPSMFRTFKSFQANSSYVKTFPAVSCHFHQFQATFRHFFASFQPFLVIFCDFNQFSIISSHKEKQLTVGQNIRSSVIYTSNLEKEEKQFVNQ